MTSTEGNWSDARSRPLPEADRLSEIIGRIYDCALDPSIWEDVLALVCQQCAFSSAMMGISRPAGFPDLLVSTGIDQNLLDLLPGLSDDMAALWGGWEQIQQFPLDEPIVNSQAIPRAQVQDNRYGAQWLARGVTDAAVVIISRTTSVVASVGFNRHETAGPIGRDEVDVLRRLTPHFRRAVKISELFDMRTVETATFSAMLDNFSFGIVLVDAHLGIVHANAVAKGLIGAQDAILSTGGLLTLSLQAAQEALQRSARLAASDNTKLGARGIDIPAQRRNGEACVIHVLPLKHSALRRGIGQRAVAALFIAPATTTRLPTDALVLLYDLTPTELRIFELIVAGETTAAISKRLRVATSTVKTHLIHLFQKTGCRRQSQLVRLAADLSIPVMDGLSLRQRS